MQVRDVADPLKKQNIEMVHFQVFDVRGEHHHARFDSNAHGSFYSIDSQEAM